MPLQFQNAILRGCSVAFRNLLYMQHVVIIFVFGCRLENPCSAREPCVPAYSFHNDLPLTRNLDSFIDAVNNVTHSSNLDNPEGGLDAMMQAIVCRVIYINFELFF